jgi:nucleotide-binding universal stress UspA family protein
MWYWFALRVDSVCGAACVSSSKILVAVSSPWASEKLVEPISDLAKRLDASAVVAHVATLQEEDEHESDATQRGEQTLKLLTEGLQQTGVSAEGLMLFSDDTPKAIMNTAHARGCTMIVLGLTGKGVLKRLIAGDVPGNIIRQADLPVLLCPANWSGRI